MDLSPSVFFSAESGCLAKVFFHFSATKAEVNALLDVNLDDANMDGFVFDIDVARRAFDHFDKVRLQKSKPIYEIRPDIISHYTPTG